MEYFYDDRDDDEYGGDGDEWSWLRMIRISMMMVMITMKKGPQQDWRLLVFNNDGDNDDE